jgi:phosphate transport system substrate-binding protein
MSRASIICLLLVICSCSADTETIRIKGSDTEVNLAVQLAESFHAINSDNLVSISGGGSGLGITSLLNGTADIANSSRSINTGELALFKTRNLPLDSFVFATDAIAFVVSDSLGIDSISVADLGAVLSGQTQNWSSLAGRDLPVTIYGRQSNSGTHDYVKQKLKIEFTPYAKQMNGNAQILEAIKADNSGIGYVGAGYVLYGGSKGIRVLTIFKDGEKATSPLDSTTIAQGNYFFERPLYQYYKQASFNKIKPFLEFEKSENGQRIIRKAGYYSVTKSRGA